MKVIAINSIKEQIRHYESQLGRYDFSKTKEEYKQRGFLEGTIYGLEQALISVNNS